MLDDAQGFGNDDNSFQLLTVLFVRVGDGAYDDEERNEGVGHVVFGDLVGAGDDGQLKYLLED